jgi:hypothetical protein
MRPPPQPELHAERCSRVFHCINCPHLVGVGAIVVQDVDWESHPAEHIICHTLDNKVCTALLPGSRHPPPT